MSGLWGPCYLTIITIISLIGQSASVVRPVVTVSPNWNKVFMGEPISLSCNVEPAEETGPLTYTWYKDNRSAKVIGELIYSGDYYCVINGKYRSDTVTLNITDPLKVAVILQAPATAVYEGDKVSLRCHSPTGYPTGETIFYRNDQVIQRASEDSYVIQSVDSPSRYRCAKEVYYFLKTYSDYGFISYTDNAPGMISVTLNPPWKKILVGDLVRMTCNGGLSDTYQWFRNNVKVAEGQSYTITSAQSGHSGSYQCRASWGAGLTAQSLIFRLEVSAGPVILQTFFPVYPGQDLTVRCHSLPDYTVHRTRLYKNGALIQESGGDGDPGPITIPNNIGGATRYSCEKLLAQNTFALYTDQAFLSVRELFQRPNITVTPDPVAEGDTMNLTCDTTLSPLRPNTPLQYIFYRGPDTIKGQKVQLFSSSNQHVIQSAQLNHSGEYFCGVTYSNLPMKRSNTISVQIEAAKKPAITVIIPVVVLLLLLVIIIVVVVVVRKRRHKQPKMSASQSQNSGPPECSSDMEVCYADLRLGHKLSRKASPPQPAADDNQVVYSEVRNHK